jgi:K+-sensing histidine kinase KdpD
MEDRDKESWVEEWKPGCITYETTKQGEVLIDESNQHLLPGNRYQTAASTVIKHNGEVFGVLMILSDDETKPMGENYLRLLRPIAKTITALIEKFNHIETIEKQRKKEQSTKEELRAANERLIVAKKILLSISDEIKEPLQGINDCLPITNSCLRDCQNTNKTIANCNRALISVVNNLIESKSLLSPGTKYSGLSKNFCSNSVPSPNHRI